MNGCSIFNESVTSIANQIRVADIPNDINGALLLNSANKILDVLKEKLPDDDPRKAQIGEQLITYVADRKGHDRRYAIAPDKIRAEIGWEPETMFEEGIRKTIEWYFDHEDWMKNVTSGDYQNYYKEMYTE